MLLSILAQTVYYLLIELFVVSNDPLQAIIINYQKCLFSHLIMETHHRLSEMGKNSIQFELKNYRNIYLHENIIELLNEKNLFVRVGFGPVFT